MTHPGGSLPLEPDLHTKEAAVERGGLGLVIATCTLVSLVCSKALVTYDAFPGWSTDPTVSDVAIGVSVGPSMQLVINALIILASLAITALGVLRRNVIGYAGPNPVSSAGLLCGAAVIGVHTLFKAPASPDAWLGGTDLLAAFAAGIALSGLDARSNAHRLGQSLLVGVVVMLCAKGLLQYLVEHPQTVEAFKASREQIFAANGWSPDSASALAYERRILQNEATGWFGLSNVFASVTGAALIVCLGLAIDARDRGLRVAILLVGVCGLISLLLSFSKGGIVAALVGVGVLCLLNIMRRLQARSGAQWQPRLYAFAFLGLIFAGQCAILARGLLGTRLGELSLLFRWFYVQGAARIFQEHPVIGTGPAGFKEAYLAAKPPISPEEVASPHSLPWDLLATLGLGGAAILVAWVILVCRTGMNAPRAFNSNQTPPASDERNELRILALFAAASGVLCIYLERTATTPESAAAKLGGLVGWILGALVLNRGLRAGATSIGLCSAAGMLIIHAQIEMTGIWTGASAWFMAMIGLAAAGGVSRAREIQRTTAWKPIAAACALVPALIISVAPIARVFRWESHLVQGAEMVLPSTRLRDALQAISAMRVSSVERERLVREAAALHTGAGVILTNEPLEPQVLRASMDAWKSAFAELELAAGAMPGEFQTRRAVSALALRIAGAADEAGDLPLRDRMVAQALAWSDVVPGGTSDRASGHAWAATVRLSLIAAEFGVDKPRLFTQARDALLLAAARDPYNFQHAASLARVELELGDSAAAQRWAARTLELESLQSLDPLKRLDERTRQAMTRLAKPSTD